MRTQFGTVLAAVCGIGGAALLSLPLAAHADETPLAETASSCVYSADTLGSPRHIKTGATSPRFGRRRAARARR